LWASTTTQRNNLKWHRCASSSQTVKTRCDNRKNVIARGVYCLKQAGGELLRVVCRLINHCASVHNKVGTAR
jgi:hypothetical protein